jgi:S-adenosyl-L-methionine hydrolase (adenosine-forming)
MRTAPPKRITLLTDFGTADGYVAAMKGVIAGIAPAARVDDASHEIPPGDVHAASWALAAYWRYYPPGTVHVVVVDPGVGSRRRALAVAADGRFLVGPDNGVFTRVLDEARAASIVAIGDAAATGAAVSATFHGRDVFAPAAAHLCRGLPLVQLGTAMTDPVVLTLPEPRVDGKALRGVIIHIDRFGNAITNVPAAAVREGMCVTVAGESCTVRRTYADAASGDLLALVGSRGVLEVAVRDGSAAARPGVERGAAVCVSDAALP